MPSSKKRRTNGTKPSPQNDRPKFQPLPDLIDDAFNALKADIEENGLHYPVIQDELGNTLDGHQRERALGELKQKNYPIKVIGGLSDDEKWEYALAVNVKRRHLNSAQKRELVSQEIKRSPDRANNWIADLTGVDVKTVQSVRKKLEGTLEIPKLKKLRGKDGKHRLSKYSQIIANTPNELAVAQSVISDLQSDNGNGRIFDTITAQRRARRNVQRDARNGVKAKPSQNSDIRLFHGPFQELEKKAKLKRSSVSLVLTDFPYGRDFLHQLSELSDFCNRVLKPGGLLVTYSGQFHLPEVLDRLGEHLTYRWQMASIWNGDSNVIHPLQMTSQWKPVLIFSKGKWKKRGMWPDVLRFEKKDKEWHDWQQNLEECESLIRYFSDAGDLVCDPCAGAFTNAIACRRNGRKFVGCDVEARCVEIGHARLAEEVGPSSKQKRVRRNGRG
jgi:ParB-like chromosome segregation protein Spo0J